MFVFQFPQCRHLPGVAALALTLAAFFAFPASAADPGVPADTVTSNVQIPMESPDETGTVRNNAAGGNRIDQDFGTRQEMDPAEDRQMEGDARTDYEMRDAWNADPVSEPRTTSSSGTRLYGEGDVNTRTEVAPLQRTARAATSNTFAPGPNHMRIMKGGTVTFNE